MGIGGLAKGTLLARWASKRRVAEDWIRLEAVGIEVKAAGSIGGGGQILKMTQIILMHN